MSKLYPLLLQPTLHTKVWGGRKLADVLQKNLPTDEPYGESWELHDTSTVTNGPLAGRTVGDLLQEFGAALAGPVANPEEGFPLLAKLLDAADWLSVQVHPNDRQALNLEGEPRGKTEAWIILATEPGAQLVIGVQPGTTGETMAEAIRAGTLEELLVYERVNSGDVLLLEANTVHAIGPGLLIYEIQQSSDTTYRLYDWNRAGLDGKPRELHIEKGVQVSNTKYLPKIEPGFYSEQVLTTLVESKYFKTILCRMTIPRVTETTLNTHGEVFHALTCIDGALTIRSRGMEVELTLGATALIPASTGIYTLVGDGDVLCSMPVLND